MRTQNQLAYGRLANTYDAFLTLTGFKRGVENFLSRLQFNLPPRARILDAGCGTGLIACYLARRYPDARIIASDIDRRMLSEMLRIVAKEGIDRSRITIAASDLRVPHHAHTFGSHERFTIPQQTLDAIFVSGALEHVPLGNTVERLTKLLKPGGLFCNLGLRRSATGAVLAMMYHCRPYRIAEMRNACERVGLGDIRVIRLSPQDFPANLSRIALIARKKK